MPKLENLTGQRFGRLTALQRDENHIQPNGHPCTCWICKCDCGNIISTDARRLKRCDEHAARSCGCLHHEKQHESGIAVSERQCVENTRLSNLKMKVPRHNTSGVIGVYWYNRKQKWVAKIEFQKQTHYLGYFDKKEDAIIARKLAEEYYFEPIIEKYGTRLANT